MAYNLPTSINASEGLLAPLKYVNTETGGIFVTMFLFSLYAIALIGGYKATKDFVGTFAVCGYFLFVVSLFAWLGDWVHWATFAISIALAIFGSVALFISN